MAFDILSVFGTFTHNQPIWLHGGDVAGFMFACVTFDNVDTMLYFIWKLK
jgi:hypothetical protein